MRVMRAETPDDLVETVEAAATQAYEGRSADRRPDRAAPDRKEEVVTAMTHSTPYSQARSLGATRSRLCCATAGDMLVVSGLGSPTYDVHAAGDHDGNYYLWGAMGGAALIGLGLAQAQPDKHVVVVTGDGEQLMAFGGLATIAVAKPRNLDIVVIDNHHFGETGMQTSHTGRGVDFATIAATCGFAATRTVSTLQRGRDACGYAAHAGRRPASLRHQGRCRQSAALDAVARRRLHQEPVSRSSRLRRRIREIKWEDRNGNDRLCRARPHGTADGVESHPQGFSIGGARHQSRCGCGA